MKDYLVLMHNDSTEERTADWGPYLDRLIVEGKLAGGSEIGGGVCYRKSGTVPGITSHLVGFIRTRAANLDEAVGVLTGNPTYEAGGTVEIRELPESD